MERALLEGEHQTEMGQLQSDQEKINQLREKQTMLIEKATREREKVGSGFGLSLENRGAKRTDPDKIFYQSQNINTG